jgi:hypothetical protein
LPELAQFGVGGDERLWPKRTVIGPSPYDCTTRDRRVCIRFGIGAREPREASHRKTDTGNASPPHDAPITLPQMLTDEADISASRSAR